MEKLGTTSRPASRAPSEETVHNVPSPADATIAPVPFSAQFLDKTPEAAAARAIYLKTVFGGVGALVVVIFAVFSIYWGSVWSTPHHSLPGWIVDFDGGAVGQSVSNALISINAGTSGIAWQVVPASQFPGGISQLQNAIVQEKTWYAVTINSGATTSLSAAVSAVDASYNSSLAITFMGSEARNENIYRPHGRIVTGQLDAITLQLTLQFLKNISSSANVGTLLSTAPELVARPIYYTVDNLRPFDVPVASAVTFVGLIYLLILSFFIVMVSTAAREISGLEKNLTLGSLVRVRIVTSFVAYFFIALFYTLLSRAFQLPFDRHFGSAGLVIFWMLNWMGMLACGLALEAVITLLTARFVPFFLIIFIITNVSVSVFPLAVLPHIYRYGYAFPFYNISRAVRSIVFRTKNDVGMNFGILIAWVALSCITLPLIQWFMRRRLVAAQAKTPTQT
ncbi:hypothetical protein DFH08DRAFT_713771 [Mycena albidolilacea]|uniref:DUF3533 domain-containing protein n=1 Tax=Mycena albidolilacea TaxID=1033008 RepID=A0AAD6ZF95_9AGAR|nr:hypothetical protein DFH08DRAFT_713771 [Mycena albidolilacea]